MSARDVIRRYFSGSDYRCDDLINTLASAGYTIVRKDEVRDEPWREIQQHVQPRLSDGYTAVSHSKPGHWLVKGPGPATSARSLKGEKG